MKFDFYYRGNWFLPPWNSFISSRGIFSIALISSLDFKHVHYSAKVSRNSDSDHTHSVIVKLPVEVESSRTSLIVVPPIVLEVDHRNKDMASEEWRAWTIDFASTPFPLELITHIISVQSPSWRYSSHSSNIFVNFFFYFNPGLRVVLAFRNLLMDKNKNIKNVTRCRDSRSVKSIETR